MKLRCFEKATVDLEGIKQVWWRWGERCLGRQKTLISLWIGWVGPCAGLGNVKGIGCRCRKVDSVPSIEKSELTIKVADLRVIRREFLYKIIQSPQDQIESWCILTLAWDHSQIVKYFWAVYLLHMIHRQLGGLGKEWKENTRRLKCSLMKDEIETVPCMYSKILGRNENICEVILQIMNLKN